MLGSAPPNGSQGVIPAQQALVFAAFDVSSVPGVAGNANIVDVPFWLGDDGNTILNNKYVPLPGQIGIPLLFSNLVSAAGAQITWMQLACANADGTLGTYGATGATLYTDQIIAYTTLAGSVASGVSVGITVTSASGFYAGDYVLLNPGGTNLEMTKILSINYVTNTLSTTGLNYNHVAGENIFCCARKFWGRGTIPLGSLSGVAASYYNLSLRFATAVSSRI